MRKRLIYLATIVLALSAVGMARAEMTLEAPVAGGADLKSASLIFQKPVLECPPDNTVFDPSGNFSINLTWVPVEGFNPNPPDNHRYQVLVEFPVPPVIEPSPRLSSVPAWTFQFTRLWEYKWSVKVVAYDPISDATTDQLSPVSNQFIFTAQTGAGQPPECGAPPTPTDAPILVAPADGSLFAEIQMRIGKFFQWLPVDQFNPDEHLYQVRVYRQTPGGRVLHWSVESSETGIQNTMLETDAIDDAFEWECRVVSKLNPVVPASVSSATRIFRTFDEYPDPVTSLDVNVDGASDAIDLMEFAAAWQTVRGSTGYLPEANFYYDNIIDARDLLSYHTRRGLQSNPDYTPLDTPVLVRPDELEGFTHLDAQEGRIVLEWGRVEGAQVYVVRIVPPNLPPFHIPVRQVEEGVPRVKAVCPAFTPTGSYVWSVVATAPGTGSPWSVDEPGMPRRDSGSSNVRSFLMVSSPQD